MICPPNQKCTVSCESNYDRESACVEATINATLSSELVVNAFGTEALVVSEVLCPPNDGFCDINCFGQAACQETEFTASNGRMNVAFKGTDSASDTLIVCESGAHCNILCDGYLNEYFITQDPVCVNTIIHAEEANSLHLTVNDGSEMMSGELWCPVNGDCSVVAKVGHLDLDPVLDDLTVVLGSDPIRVECVSLNENTLDVPCMGDVEFIGIVNGVEHDCDLEYDSQSGGVSCDNPDLNAMLLPPAAKKRRK
eukprot:295910_1